MSTDRWSALSLYDDESEQLGQRLRAEAQDQHPQAMLQIDARRLRAGDVLVACPGSRQTLPMLVQAARAAQASRVLVDADALAQLTPAEQAGIRLEAVPQLWSRRGLIASAFYGHPSRQLKLTAITGTNGKSSVVHGLTQAWAALGEASACIGTLGVSWLDAHGVRRDHALPGPAVPPLTTPDAVELQAILSGLLALGIRRVHLEASSIGIEQHRLTGCALHAAALTSLGHDHLDFHGSLQAYYQEKAKLFEGQPLGQTYPGGRVLAWPLPMDQPEVADWVRQVNTGLPEPILAKVEDLAPLIQTGLKPQVLGQHNRQNLSVIYALLRAEGLGPEACRQALSAVQTPTGRLETVTLEGPSASQGPRVVLDYAHTPDALEAALLACREQAELQGGRLWLVFGCGGDRDPSKRPRMGETAARLADQVVITADNPRSESAQAIAEAILAGVQDPASARRCHLIADRREAIQAAVDHAEPQDLVLLAGKGHETTQTIGEQVLPFSDQAAAADALRHRSPPWTLGRLAELLGQPWPSNAGLPAAVRPWGISTDSRSIQPGQVFVALVGERFDGHTHLAQAFERGALAAVVQALPKDHGLTADQQARCLMVPNTLEALGQLAHAWRQAWTGQLLAVVGSNGKTTVKEMISAIGREALGREAVWATPGNLNNAVGLPLTLLRLHPRHRLAVIEIGMNHPGEMPALCRMASPSHALLTNAQREHLGHMKSVAAAAHENGQVFETLPSTGVVMVPNDPEHLPIWIGQAGKRTLRQFRLLPASAELTPGLSHLDQGQLIDRLPPRLARLAAGSDLAQQQVVSLRGLGEHFAQNALASLLAAEVLGLDLKAAGRALQGFEPVAGRGRIHSKQAYTVVDDSYNANPDSMEAAIRTLSQLPGERHLVMGDMGEMGETAADEHLGVLRCAAAHPIDQVWLLGTDFAQAAQTLGSASGMASKSGVQGPVFQPFETAEALSDALLERLASGPKATAVNRPVVWVKGSRFMRMERVVTSLIKGQADAAALV